MHCRPGIVSVGSAVSSAYRAQVQQLFFTAFTGGTANQLEVLLSQFKVLLRVVLLSNTCVHNTFEDVILDKETVNSITSRQRQDRNYPPFSPLSRGAESLDMTTVSS